MVAMGREQAGEERADRGGSLRGCPCDSKQDLVPKYTSPRGSAYSERDSRQAKREQQKSGGTHRQDRARRVAIAARTPGPAPLFCRFKRLCVFGKSKADPTANREHRASGKHERRIIEQRPTYKREQPDRNTQQKELCPLPHDTPFLCTATVLNERCGIARIHKALYSGARYGGGLR